MLPGAASHEHSGHDPENSARRRGRSSVLIVALIGLVVMGLLALAAAVDIGSSDSVTVDRTDAGGDEPVIDVAIDEIVGVCDGGLGLGPDVIIVSDPEDCGFGDIPPGTQFEQDGYVICIVSKDTPFRFRLVGDRFDLLPPGSGDAADLEVTSGSDGDFLFRGNDGSGARVSADGEVRETYADRSGELGRAAGESADSGNDIGESGVTRDDADEPNGIDETGDDTTADADVTDTDTDATGAAEAPADGVASGDDAASAQPDATGEADSPSNPSGSTAGGAGAAILLVLLVVVGAVIVALVVASTRRRSVPTVPRVTYIEDETPSEESTPFVAELSTLDRMLWEIGNENDPRRSIVRMFAALESGLGRAELARRSSETPGVFVRRILGSFDALAAPLEELTRLFELARYSDHEVTDAMRARAIDVLEEIRAYYASREEPEPVSVGAAVEPS